MTKHDEVRQILFDNGFKFDDGRTALDMTDEEVEAFLVEFISRLAALGRQMQVTMRTLAVSFTRIATSMQDLGKLLEEAEKRKP